MALQPSSHPRVHSAHASSHASHTHAAHAASKARPALSAEEGEGGGFAAQLLKAQPAAGKDLKADDARPKAEASKKPEGDKDGQSVGLLLLRLGVGQRVAHRGHLLVAALLLAFEQGLEQGQALHACSITA